MGESLALTDSRLCIGVSFSKRQFPAYIIARSIGIVSALPLVALSSQPIYADIEPEAREDVGQSPHPEGTFPPIRPPSRLSDTVR